MVWAVVEGGADGVEIALRGELAIDDEDDAFADFFDFFEDVGGDDDGSPFIGGLMEDFLEAETLGWIGAVQGFVEDQDFGVADQCSG